MDNLSILELLVKKHCKEEQLTPEEDAALRLALESNEEARQMEKDILSIPTQEVEKLFQKTDWENMFSDVLQGATEARRKKRQHVRWAMAAVVTGLIVTVGMYLVQKPAGTNNFVDNPAPVSGATLQLASGEIVQLSDSGKQDIAIGNAAVQNFNRVLKIPAPTNSSGAMPAGYNTINVPNRLDYRINLPDGSTVWLNSASSFRFPTQFSNSTREVYIERGEAYFLVAKNITPFIVHTSTGDIQVLGTEFNVNVYNEGSAITSLVTGKVMLTDSLYRKELKPGLQGIIKRGQTPIVQKFDVHSTVSWREGVHYFQDVPLNEVAVMLERWFDVPLHIDDPGIAAELLRCNIHRRLPIQKFMDDVNGIGVVTFYWKGKELHCKKNVATMPAMPMVIIR
jgi:hypothetical protein